MTYCFFCRRLKVQVQPSTLLLTRASPECSLACVVFQVIAVESVQVEAKSKLVRVDEEAATLKANESQALKDECESDLAEAIPALEMALSALNTLKVHMAA